MKPLAAILLLAMMLVGCAANKQQVIVVHDRIPECPRGPVSVYDMQTGALATLYADAKLTIPMVNPFTPACNEGPSYTFYTNISNLRIVEGN